ncbi:MAG: hypothetical protein WBF90_22195 [Rivularia sp. (in: cyanobacteria)]
MRKSVASKKFILSTIVLEVLVIGSALLRAFLLNVNPKRYFDDQGYVSWFSFLQILFAAFLAWKVYKSRKSDVVINDSNKSKSYNLWAIISFGFLFLGLDEILKIHENVDFFIHDFFQIQETANTDRIDSLIVLIYALFGVGILYWAKSELSKFSQAFPLFGLAISLTFAMIFLDLLTDTTDFFDWLITNDSISYIVYRSLGILEECCKIFAEGMFIIAIYCCLQISKKQKYFSR